MFFIFIGTCISRTCTKLKTYLLDYLLVFFALFLQLTYVYEMDQRGTSFSLSYVKYTLVVQQSLRIFSCPEANRCRKRIMVRKTDVLVIRHTPDSAVRSSRYFFNKSSFFDHHWTLLSICPSPFLINPPSSNRFLKQLFGW